MKTRNGFIDKKLVFVLVASVAFFLWLRYESATDRNDDVESTADAMVTTTAPGQSGENDAKPVQSNAKSAASSDVQDTAANDKPRFKIFGSTPATETGSNSAQSGAESDEPAYEIPLGDLAISGRVLTRSGAPVASAQVTASASYIFEEGKRKAIPRGARQRKATTSHDGAYSFEELANGEYNVSTVATDRYRRASIQVRAGVDFADLIVATHQNIRVQGIVTIEGGEPLFGVRVRPNLAGASEVTSNREGRYGFDAMLPDSQSSLMVRATRDGYGDREVQLATDRTDETSVLELNIVMQADADTELADISGTVKDADRDPIA
ncbi:MAG: carboxypeptidase-like regulatory domain-containing protein, partial [Gammaproteobacteria bacterium]